MDALGEDSFNSEEPSSWHNDTFYLKNKYPGAQFLTLLREPFTRLISNWLYWSRHTDEDLSGMGERGVIAARSRLGLQYSLKDPDLIEHYDNIATRIILGPEAKRWIIIPSTADRDLIRKATSALSQFSYVDFVENKNLESNLQQWLDVKIPLYKENENGWRPEQCRGHLLRQLDLPTIDLACSYCRLDRVLWRGVVRAIQPELDLEKFERDLIATSLMKYAYIYNTFDNWNLSDAYRIANLVQSSHRHLSLPDTPPRKTAVTSNSAWGVQFIAGF